MSVGVPLCCVFFCGQRADLLSKKLYLCVQESSIHNSIGTDQTAYYFKRDEEENT